MPALQRFWKVFIFIFLNNCLRTCAWLMRAPMNPSGVGGIGYLRETGGLDWDSEGLMWNSFHSLIGLLAFTSTYPLQRSQRLVCCQISCGITWFTAGLPLNPTVAAPVWCFSWLIAACFLGSFRPWQLGFKAKSQLFCIQRCTDGVIGWQSCQEGRF